ncbi:methionine ABC transporter ATP-binding protein [Clostridium aminobutyricum]|uniref:ATP-binding cassette domain-containing protein n=1 Tax=Clostridium aminobutyricum TaxID=33953 RepID=A0A939DAL9_CLOAM|nr:ATP-binding cassette domain-containing protein [Clostridium aminobutyricum]MBN7774469.1 ATP-binding cassette domain-containing protein [Clostridium aminobutyricum]
MIVLENISKTFDTEKQTVYAVNNVSLTIQQGEIYGIIGFSGAGKSTLVRCINLLEVPTSGKVFVNDTELTGLSEKELRKARKKIGMIFQQFNLFASRTVFQNIAYPLKSSGLTKSEIRAKVYSLLDLVDLKDKETAYPSQLSGGQKQRVAIARALANDPQILLCDEATSALDPQTTLSILKLLKKLNQELGLTIVIITHEMQVVKEICDKVAVMEKGSVVEKGDVFSVFATAKQKITQDFIDTTSNLSKIYSLIEEEAPITNLKAGQCILKLKYLERNVSEALISQISRQFHIDANIIFGNIELIGEEPLGGLVAIISGEKQNIDEAISYLQSKNVGVEVILDARTLT